MKFKMKIEAKKYKYSLNKNDGNRPAQPATAERAPRAAVAERPRLPGITLPKIRFPKITIPRVALPKMTMPDMTISRFKAPQLRGRRSLRIAAFLAGVPAAIIIAWLGVNLIHRPVPPPLFTERDLQQLPPAESNGYAYLYDDRIAGEYAAKDISDNYLFRNAASLELFLDKTRGEYSMARTLAVREDVKKMIGLYGDIMKKQVFADMTMPQGNDLQKARAFYALHNAMTATIIARMQEKKPGAALAMMKDQLDLTVKYARSARSMFNYTGALQVYDKSLDILKSMLAVSGGAMGKDAIASCREIAGVARSFNPATIPLDRIVVFEYIISWRRAFDPSIPHPEESVRRGMKYKKLVFFDRGATQRLYDRRWKELHDYAKSPNEQGLGELMKLREGRYAAGGFWWLNNAVGKKYLDTIGIPAYQLFLESKSRGDAIMRKQGEIVPVIDALKEAAPGKKAVKGKGKRRAR